MDESIQTLSVNITARDVICRNHSTVKIIRFWL